MPASAGPDSRTALVRRYRGERWFTSTEPTWGADEETGLRVQVDPTGWVLDVALEEVVPGLRTAEGLHTALVDAIGNATLAHVAARARERRLSTEEVLTARELLSGRRRLTRVTIPAPAPMTYPTGPFTPRTAGDHDLVSRTWSGWSRGRELRVVMTSIAGLRSIEATPDFLATMDPRTLRFAVREAFDDAATETQEPTR